MSRNLFLRKLESYMLSLYRSAGISSVCVCPDQGGPKPNSMRVQTYNIVVFLAIYTEVSGCFALVGQCRKKGYHG